MKFLQSKLVPLASQAVVADFTQNEVGFPLPPPPSWVSTLGIDTVLTTGYRHSISTLHIDTGYQTLSMTLDIRLWGTTLGTRSGVGIPDTVLTIC